MNRTQKLPGFDAQRDGQYVSLFVSLIAQKNKSFQNSAGLNQFTKSHPPKSLTNMPVGYNATIARTDLNYSPIRAHTYISGDKDNVDLHLFADDDLQIALAKEWNLFQQARNQVRTALGGVGNSLSPYLVAHVYLEGNLQRNIKELITNFPSSPSAQSNILQTLSIQPFAKEAVEMSQKYMALEEGNILQMETEVTGLDMPLFLSRYQQVKQKNPQLSVENISTQSQSIQLLEAVRDVDGNSNTFRNSINTFIEGIQNGDSAVLAKFLILQNAMARYDENQGINANAKEKTDKELLGEGKNLANFAGNSLEKMFDLIQNGDNMAKASAIGILSVLVLGVFGKGPLGQNAMIKNALVGLGLAAAIEKVGTEMNGGLSPFQGLYDMFEKNPTGFRQQFLKRNGIENRNNEILISKLEDVPMKQLLDYRKNINEQVATGKKNISYYDAKSDFPPEAIRKAIREASRENGMPYEKELLGKMIYEISGKLMLDIGQNQSETTASKTQGTLIHEGEQYSREHYEQNTMGNVLDIYEGTQMIKENLSMSQKVREMFGDSAEWVWNKVQHFDGAMRDEAIAFLKRIQETKGENLWKGVKLLFARGWNLTKQGANKGANFVFTTKIPGTDFSLQNTIWDRQGTDLDAWGVLSITGNALKIPLQVMQVTAEGAIAIGEFLAKHGNDETVIKLFSEGWANTKWFFDYIMGTGVYENPIDISASGAAPDDFYLNEVFGQYGDEVFQAKQNPTMYHYNQSENAYYGVGMTDMVLSSDEQNNPELKGEDARILYWREKALKAVVEKGNLLSSPPPSPPFVSGWQENLSQYIIGTTIVTEGSKKKMMVALRVPTQPEKESAGRRKTAEYVLSQRLSEYMKTTFVDKRDGRIITPSSSSPNSMSMEAFLVNHTIGPDSQLMDLLWDERSALFSSDFMLWDEDVPTPMPYTMNGVEFFQRMYAVQSRNVTTDVAKITNKDIASLSPSAENVTHMKQNFGIVYNRLLESL
ncbi:hypothetical protein IPN35_02360 [Candidatus Peregrinibacteria bacterium]|nr:MAG: hypothetical protein IPN35_02360 [Candidatus Peregrinibacteria bacterium]